MARWVISDKGQSPFFFFFLDIAKSIVGHYSSAVFILVGIIRKGQSGFGFGFRAFHD
jgi:hypothetical protein